MKHFRLITALLITVLSVLTLIGCNNEGTADTIPDDTTAREDSPTTEAPTEAPVPKIDVTIQIKDQDGNPMAEAVITILPVNADGESATLTADNDGKLSVSLPAGEYTVRFDVLPEYVLGVETTLTVAANMEPVILEVTDNTPNGSEDRPFVINEDTISVKIPADTTYHFTLFGANNRTLTYIHTDVILMYNEGVYQPDGAGLLEVRMSTASPRDPAFFALKNTGSAEAEITIRLLSDPGAMDNPIVIEKLGELLTANVPQDGMIYYRLVATASGTLRVTSSDTINNISLNNLTTSQVSDFSAGGESVALNVTEGDVITIVVSVIGGDKQAEFNSVNFTVTLE